MSYTYFKFVLDSETAKERKRSAGCSAVSYCNVVCIVKSLNENKYTDFFLQYIQLIISNEFQYKMYRCKIYYV